MITLTVIEAAVIILSEENKPLSSRDIALEILNRNMVISKAKDKCSSIAATILKTINYRDIEIPICYWNDSSRNKLIGLKEWKENKLKSNITEDYNASKDQKYTEEKSTIMIPKRIEEKLRFTYNANLKDSYDEHVIYIIEKGLEASEDEVKKALNRRINEIFTFETYSNQN